MPAPFVEPADIRGLAWGGGYERGLAYSRAGAVQATAWDEASRTLTSTVRGSGSKVYRCTIRFDVAGRGGAVVSATCSCPMQADCKHTVATLLASNGETSAFEPAPPTAPSPEPPAATSWRSLLPADATAQPSTPTTALALGVELRQRSAYLASQWAPRRVVAVAPRDLAARADDLTVGVRPLMRGGRGAWIKGDASWDGVRRPNRTFDPAQARWFSELYSIAHDVRATGPFADVAEWLTLDAVESGLLWPHLAAAADLGIPFAATASRQAVTLAASASVRLDLARAADGALRLSPVVHIDGDPVNAAAVRTIGGSGLYWFTVDRDPIHLTLAPASVPQPARALIAASEPVLVPAADTDEFLRVVYPRLTRRIDVTVADGIEVPAPTPPELELSVAFRPGDTVEYAMRWSYPGLVGFDYATSPHPDRDPVHENASRDRIERAWEAATTSTFSPTGVLHDVAAAEFAARVLPALESLPDVRADITGTRRRYGELEGVPSITVSTVESADLDWFDLGIIVTIDGRRIPFAPLLTALTQGRTKLLLADGAYFSLAHPALHRLRELIDEAAELSEWETGPRISRHQVDLWSDFEDLADEAEPAVSWRATVQGLRDAAGIAHTPAPAGLHARLRPYQQTGLDWLAFLFHHRLGGILADDMGLGKTLQMLALIAHTRDAGQRRPFLVAAPTSVTSTWADEARRFAPDLIVRTIAATRAKGGASVTDAATTADVIITSYTLLRLDRAEFAATEWAGIVLDEAQFVKNPQTKLHRAVRELRAPVTFAITGTPMENSLTDLWSLLSLTAPGLFPSARRFREEYVKPIEQGKVPENAEGGPFRAARLARLRRRIRPLVLRRTKEVVAPELPPKQEQEVRVELGPAHRAIYDTVLQRERQKVLGLLDDLDRQRFIVFRSLTLLRMLSLAPVLIDPAHSRIPSTKIDALLERLDEIVAEGHRTLVFSQFTSYLALVSDRLDAAGIAYEYLDGSTRRRPEVIEAFRSGDAPVFLISLKAGGFGLTLTEADYVFLLDPWWNPAAESQAIDRTHRIGQTRSVNVYRLIAAGTIEEKVVELQGRKARLFSSVMDDGDLFSQSLTADDIRGLLEA